MADIIQQLEASSEPWVDRSSIESLLGVGRRRAQQLLAPIAKRRIGASVVAERADVIARLRQLAAGEVASYEEQRRKKLSAHLDQARREWVEHPPVLVEVSSERVRRIESHDFDGLPEGVELAPGSITVRFESSDEALRKLMALALAISRSRDAFDERVSPARSPEARAIPPELF